MTITGRQLLDWLQKIDSHKLNYEVTVMIETKDCQYEYPLNDIATCDKGMISQKQGRIILMHEKGNKD